MEGQLQPGNSQYQYQWSRLVRRNTAEVVPISEPSIAVPSQLPKQIDLLPILLPQHSLYHQRQLAQYNRLITSGRTTRLQTSPLPPLVSTQNIQAVPGSRASVGGGTTARPNRSSSRGGHGNKETRKSSKGERALVTEKEKAAKMPPKLPSRPNTQQHNSNFSVQSNSVPSTPHQHARKFSFESREPSPNATNGHSPRSAYSENNITVASSKPLHNRVRGGCRYETAMVHTKRRMPYTDEKLVKLDPADVKSKLSEDEERKLSTDMRELYDRLLPTPGSEKNRERLVQKLEKLFNDAWPGHNTKVHVFGSSGNLLCTDESDVDICITTDMKEMEDICKIADLLAKNGMQKVICVSTAKVPIVKIWDPELGLACDMNVNNTLALENTRMIKTYVQIDPRVRPLAMIIKHWTKRRIVNDAAFGGTLSSYTWICMIINFLQSRTPPVLPALHQRPHLKLPAKNGVESSFADDVDALSNFGRHNKETLGELLFQFFRFYGHEFDYDKLVISVRNGKQISKVDKKWNHTNNNQLCVEEPFNVDRNLGNTADDSSFRGLQLELRRAFDLISQGKLEECCEQYQYPKEEERVTYERPAQNTKPVSISISHSSSQNNRGGRGGSHRRGSRNTHNSNGNGNRRASSGAFDNSPSYIPGLPANLSVQEAWLQRQAQAQLHNDLYATYSVLQAQENSLRLQLYAQGLQNQVYAQQAQAQANGATKSQSSDRNRTNSFDQPPLTAPIRPDMFYYPMYPASMYGFATPSTNPSSPSLSSAVPASELRRSMHRSSATNGSGQGVGQSNSSLRSHSQPAARSGPSPLSLQSQIPNPGLGIYQSRQAHIPNFIADENMEYGFRTPGRPSGTPPGDSTSKEYVGYYVNDHTASPVRRPSATYSAQPLPIPTFGEISGQARRRPSTDQLPQSVLDRLKRPSRSPSPLGHDRSYSTGAHSAPVTAAPSQQGISSSNLRMFNNQTPLVVNGSNPGPVSIPTWQAAVSEGSMLEDHNSDVLAGSIDSNSQISGTESDISEQDLSGQLTPRDFRPESAAEPPMVANGSSQARNDTAPMATSSHLNDITPRPTHISNGLVAVDYINGGPLRLSPNGNKNRIARPVQNGGISPLDIGLSQNENFRDDLPHLSPVYEARTPSPTANRKFEPDRKMNGLIHKQVDDKPEASKSAHKLTFANGTLSKPTVTTPKVNGHTRASKSEGAGPGTWQPVTKNKKKGHAGDIKSAGNGLPIGEKFPPSDLERKGG